MKYDISMELVCQSIPNYLLKNCRVFNNRENLIDLLDSNLNIAEIGVSDGNFSQLLQRKAKFLCLIDYFKSNDWPSTKRFTPDTHIDFIKNKFKDQSNVRICQGDSLIMLNGFDDGNFDVIYIDGGSMPAYDIFKKRLFLAYLKLKVGGTLWINDYTTCDPHTKSLYGIQKAVNELINIYQMDVSYLSLNNSNFHDICLRRVDLSNSGQINFNRLALYSSHYGNFFLLKNEEFIAEPLKRGEHWEDNLLQLVLPYLHKQNTVIDIGAHVGCHTIPYARRVGKVYAFEPQQLLYRILIKNCGMNQLDNVKICNYALGHLNNQSVTMSSEVQDGVSKNEKVSYETDKNQNYGGLQLGVGGQQVMMKTLDSFEFKEPIRYIKVDAEGSEPLIFYGAQKLIRRDTPIILYENRPNTIITEGMKAIMSITPEIEQFSIENLCVNELKYHKPITLENSNLLLIPSHLSLPKGF